LEGKNTKNLPLKIKFKHMKSMFEYFTNTCFLR